MSALRVIGSGDGPEGDGPGEVAVRLIADLAGIAAELQERLDNLPMEDVESVLRTLTDDHVRALLDSTSVLLAFASAMTSGYIAAMRDGAV